MGIGDLLKERCHKDELAIPSFIWEVIEHEGQTIFVISTEKGMTKIEVERKFSHINLILPPHSKFTLLSKQELTNRFEQQSDDDFEFVSNLIRNARDTRTANPNFLINVAYGGMVINHTLNFIKSAYCEQAEDRINQSPHILIKPLTSIIDKNEREQQNLKNLDYLLTLDFIPKRFVLLKIISKAKEVVEELFPPGNDQFSNSIFEKMMLAMGLTYYEANREKIKSVTINFGQKFPGEFKVFQQFTSMLDKFDEEIKMYHSFESEQLKIELSLTLSGVKIPERDNGKGIVMKLLEFDLSFWQRLILLDIDTDVPVRKPFKNGFSISYNYMLLLPFFQWLAPHHFPKYKDKRVNAETFQKTMVERMKNFVEGKIS